MDSALGGRECKHERHERVGWSSISPICVYHYDLVRRVGVRARLIGRLARYIPPLVYHAGWKARCVFSTGTSEASMHPCAS